MLDESFLKPGSHECHTIDQIFPQPSSFVPILIGRKILPVRRVFATGQGPPRSTIKLVTDQDSFSTVAAPKDELSEIRLCISSQDKRKFLIEKKTMGHNTEHTRAFRPLYVVCGVAAST